MSEPTSRRPAYARLLDRAVRITAVRDHSEQELRRKLSAPVMSKNGPEEIDATAEDYDRVVARCYEHHYGRRSLCFPLSRQPRPQGLRPCAHPAGAEPERGGPGVHRKAMRECEIDWCELAKSRRFASTANRCRVNFQKKSKSSAFALPRLSDGRYSGYLA